MSQKSVRFRYICDATKSDAFPPYDLGISGTFLSKELHVIYKGARAETEKALFFPKRECYIHQTRSIKTNSAVNLSRKPEAAETGVSDQQGRKTAELHTSGAKQAETWQGGVKWGELAIGLAVASGGETETGED